MNTTEEQKKINRINFGALFLTLPWCIWYRVKAGLLLLIPIILGFVLPKELLGAIILFVSIPIKIYISLKANRVVINKNISLDLKKYFRDQRKWSYAIIILFVILVGIFYFSTKAYNEYIEKVKDMEMHARMENENGYK